MFNDDKRTFKYSTLIHIEEMRLFPNYMEMERFVADIHRVFHKYEHKSVQVDIKLKKNYLRIEKALNNEQRMWGGV